MESNLQGTFLLNNAPLAQFSEMKAPVCQYSVQNSFYKLSPPGLGPQLAAGTPHGITDILSRPVATPNSSLLSGYPHVAGFGGLGSQGVYYGPQVGNFSKAGNEYPTRTRNCWADTGQDWRGGRQCSNSEYDGGKGGAGGRRCPKGTLTVGPPPPPTSPQWPSDSPTQKPRHRTHLSAGCRAQFSPPRPTILPSTLLGQGVFLPIPTLPSCHLGCPPRELGSLGLGKTTWPTPTRHRVPLAAHLTSPTQKPRPHVFIHSRQCCAQ